MVGDECSDNVTLSLNTAAGAALQGMRIVVVIDSWPADSKNPLGHFARLLGKVGDPEVETEVVLIEHEIAYEPFSQASVLHPSSFAEVFFRVHLIVPCQAH